jgi:hypothetical protein
MLSPSLPRVRARSYAAKEVDSWVFSFQSPLEIRSYEMNAAQFITHLGELHGKADDDVLTYQTEAGSATDHNSIEELISEMEEAARALDLKLRDYGWVFVGSYKHDKEETEEEEETEDEEEDDGVWAAESGGASSSVARVD